MYLCGITPQPGGTGPSASLRASKDLAKTALGAEQTVPWERGRRAGDVLRKLRTQGFQIVGLEQDTCSRDIFSFTPKKKVLLVLGEEVKGLPAALRRQCGTILEIPMLGKKESLNVSVAFGIAGYLLKFKIK
jgi:tRNA G18 (ribose-2'-O)-methylase SpoU